MSRTFLAAYLPTGTILGSLLTVTSAPFLQDTYDHEPAPGRQKNDLKLVTAIAYKF